MCAELSKELREIVPTIYRSTLFQGLAEDEVRTILPCLGSRLRSYDRDEYIWRYGDSINSVGFVVSGRVHLIEEDFWGNRNILAQVDPGEVFGEAYACVPGSCLQSGVVVVEPARVLFMDIQRMACSCTNSCAFHQRLSQNLLAEVARKNLRLTEKLGHTSKRSTREKLLSYLSAESQRQGHLIFDIPFNRQQLADYLSVDRSAMSSELGKLRDEGLIAFSKNHFELREA